MTAFFEVIAQYTDGESIDVLINVANIVHLRPYALDAQHSVITLANADPLQVSEPYAEVKRKILWACAEGSS